MSKNYSSSFRIFLDLVIWKLLFESIHDSAVSFLAQKRHDVAVGVLRESDAQRQRILTKQPFSIAEGDRSWSFPLGLLVENYLHRNSRLQ